MGLLFNYELTFGPKIVKFAEEKETWKFFANIGNRKW